MSLGGRPSKREKDVIALRVRAGVLRSSQGWHSLVEVNGQQYTLGEVQDNEADAEAITRAWMEAWREAVDRTDGATLVDMRANLQRANARWS